MCVLFCFVLFCFLEFPCLLHDPTNAGDLISGSSAFSKCSLYIWKFSAHVLMKSTLKDFEQNLISMWNKRICTVVWTFFGLPFFGIAMKTDLFQSWGHCQVFQICWHVECSTLTASTFRIWSSSAGIPSPPLDLFTVMLPKAHLTSHSRMSGSRWVTTPLWLSGSLRIFFVQFCVFLPPLLNIFCFCYAFTIFVLYCDHLCMKCSPGISSLSHSIIFPYFFALFT